MRPTLYYAIVLPIAVVLYVIILISTDSLVFAIIGAVVIALLALAPTFLVRKGVGPFRGRDRTA